MLETPANGSYITGKVRLEHAVGMHARPAVKLTKLAKRFQAQISIRASEAADWINAKSVAKVMALRAPRNSMIEIALALMIFAIVGMLGTLHPAIHTLGT